MPRIYIEFARMKQVGSSCKSVSSKVEQIRSDFQRAISQLDWDIKYQSDINSTATQLARKLEGYTQALKGFQSFIDDTYDKYVRLDEENKNDLKSSIISVTFDPDRFRPLGPGVNPFANWWNNIKDLLENVKEEEDLLSVVKTLLKGYDSWGKIDEAGILKDVISYVENFSAFFLGDKKGLTGASDWCDLADSSIGVWTGLYDYYSNMYKGLKTGFFGEVAQKNVKILGLSAGFLGLTASVLSASDGLDKKNWQNTVADYVDCGKDVISVIKSGYALKHIGDVKSLSEIKAGPWSALNIYAAIGDAGVRSVSQGFRSHEKYYADGQWDLGDTGATGIDISMAGIYGISHSLTLGFDDLIFGAIDKATGGNGNSDMTYYEKAAEGYKILATKCGEAIGNWWVNLTK